MAPSKPKTKVAVIGAGAAGLCAGRHLIADPDNFQFDIYEQQDDVGGTWRYSSHIGQDQYGLPVHSSMYKNLKTNLPKEAMAFPDFPFEDCEGESFVHHTLVLRYLEDYAKHYHLYQHIKFHKLIENVRPLMQSDDVVEWSVSFSDVVTKERETYIYDAVMVCNGHYSVPYVPELPGLKEEFEGLVIHSHDYREPEAMRGMRVVVLGAGASGIDIGIEIASVAKEVILSHNTPPKSSPLPPNVRQEKGIKEVLPKSVTFIGDKEATPYDCDAIVLCTGYLYHYPFLDPSCGVEIGDQLVSSLYLHLFLVSNPTLAIWAVPKLILPFPIYDQQTKLFVRFLKGEVDLPGEAEMRRATAEDFARRVASGLYGPRHMHVMRGEWQWEYDDAVSRLGRFPTVKEAVRNLFRHVHRVRTADLVSYKNTKYSLVDDETFVERK